jgi:hypothetical protein
MAPLPWKTVWQFLTKLNTELSGRLYSYPYLNQQKPLFLPIIAYTLSTTKLEIRAK